MIPRISSMENVTHTSKLLASLFKNDFEYFIEIGFYFLREGIEITTDLKNIVLDALLPTGRLWPADGLLATKCLRIGTLRFLLDHCFQFWLLERDFQNFAKALKNYGHYGPHF
eukprot:TRINITY_DN18323_c0_g1_i1.p1 TRINITY_DN18323_c0_g1~~TRINITY_DN18323_c0_g1_i1.p1  ORF type:complete len:126 (-),score=8.94 TRINITY_DN18323_c0_g1_i1:39-377(-)